MAGANGLFNPFQMSSHAHLTLSKAKIYSKYPFSGLFLLIMMMVVMVVLMMAMMKHLALFTLSSSFLLSTLHPSTHFHLHTFDNTLDNEDGDDDDDNGVGDDSVKLILPLTFICTLLHNNEWW